MKKRILVDMDDVLADASERILEILNQKNNLSLSKDFFDDKDFYDYVKSNNLKSYRDELNAPGFFGNLNVIPDSQEVLAELSEKHEVFIVSAAMEFPNSLKEKYDWMQTHFPFISWKNIMLCGDKSIVKGDILIDDHEKNLIHFDGETILFDAIHNKKINNYNRISNWLDIKKHILG
jgi:5'-nucleotidase